MTTAASSSWETRQKYPSQGRWSWASSVPISTGSPMSAAARSRASLAVISGKMR